MKFTPITNTILDAQVLEQDLAQAKKFSKIAVGEKCLYYTGLLQTGYLPLEEIVWAYRRQEDCQSNLCCGRMSFESFFLMVTTKEKKQKKTSLEVSRDVKEILELLAERNPGIDIGYSQEKAEKYL